MKKLPLLWYKSSYVYHVNQTPSEEISLSDENLSFMSMFFSGSIEMKTNIGKRLSNC